MARSGTTRRRKWRSSTTARGGITGAHLLADRMAGRGRAHREDGEVEEQRRGPGTDDRPLRRRHRPALHHRDVTAGSDAGVVRPRGGRRVEVPAKGCGASCASTSTPGPVPRTRRPAGSTERGASCVAAIHETIAKVSDDVGTPLQVQHRVRRLPRARQRRHGVRREHRRPGASSARRSSRWSLMLAPMSSPTSVTRCGRRSDTGSRSSTRHGRWPTRLCDIARRDRARGSGQRQAARPRQRRRRRGRGKPSSGGGAAQRAQRRSVSSARSRSGKSSWCPDGSSTSSYDTGDVARHSHCRPPGPGAKRRNLASPRTTYAGTDIA